MKGHKTKITENRSKQASFMVKWDCSCGASGYEPKKEDAVQASRTHRFANQEEKK